MPQPISRVVPNASIVLGNVGDRPLARHPDLALLAIEAISSWSNVENFLLKLFVQLFGGTESLATNVFLSLENQSAKTAALNAAALTVFQDGAEEYRVFRAILAIAKTNEKDRNKLAHWTWGDSPNIPDGVLLVDPRASIAELDRSKVYVYKEKDFLSIVEANNRLCVWRSSGVRPLGNSHVGLR